MTRENKKIFLFVLPAILLVSCIAVFKVASSLWGLKAGYFIGFLFYWLFWCLLIPLQIIGFDGIVRTFQPGKKNTNFPLVFCLLAPLIFVYTYAFPSALIEANNTIILFSLLVAI